MAALTEDLRAFVEAGVAIVVGTRDSARAPEITRGWGVHALREEDAIEVCLPLASSRRTLDNLADNGRIAVTLALPSTYRAVQIKGRAISISDPSADDLDRVDRHQRAFVREAATVGLPERQSSRLFAVEPSATAAYAKVRVEIEEIFDQTPGPTAGARL